MPDVRPDPDQLLAQVVAAEARARRGRLRIFFGAMAGVGKTYAMLEAARSAQAAGRDIAVGYVQPHGREETERLMEGLEQLPLLSVSYRGIAQREFDLDAALQRHPAILVVDELAHSNLQGGDPPPRHPKRWQDIEELLAAGIDVWTTVNVQHLESLNDVVARITGVRQRETIPDRVFDEADEVELIDLPPDELLARLQGGKIYIPAEIGTAVERFFRRTNLSALRELALRRTADRVEAASRVTASAAHAGRTWLARERVLVAIGPDEQAEQLIRAGKRLADALDAGWVAVYVETPALLRLSAADRNRRIDVLRLAESLGAEAVTLSGPTAADALLEYAAMRQVTKLVVGAPKRRGWRALLRPSTVTALTRQPRDFDLVTVAAAKREAERPTGRGANEPAEAPPPLRWGRYAGALAITAVCTLIVVPMADHFELANIVMVYLLGVTVAGLRIGRGPSVLTALLNVAAFDFFCVPPRFTFAISDAQYLLTFGVMLTIALVIATLVASVRQQTRVAGARERRTAMLYAMSRELAATRDLPTMSRIAIRHVAEVFQCHAALLLPDASGTLQQPGAAVTAQTFNDADLAVGQWVADHGHRAGLGSDTLPAAPALYLPLGDDQRRLGVLAVLPANPRRVLLPEQRHLLETFAGQIGVAIERARLADASETLRVAAQSENLRNTLLASISHDLRTPLAVIAGAGSTLAEQGAALDDATRQSLARSIEAKAGEMSELISNVLDLMRWESGEIRLRRNWESIDDLLGMALQRVGPRLQSHPLELQLAADLPPVFVDASLTVQVLANLLDNAAKYTPPGAGIRVSATAEESWLRVAIEDEGPGLPPGDPARLFDKFQRGTGEGSVVGVGLGLAICRAIVTAHGSTIQAGTRPGGGARFEFTLATLATPP
jgi:two-component system sensor histidine kinase KdpD